MKQKISGCLLIIALFISQSAFGEETGRLGVGASIAYMDYEPSTIADVDFELAKTPVYAVNFTLHFTENYSVEAGGETRKSEMEVSVDSDSGIFGELTQKSIYATGRYRFRITRTNTFIHLGLGAAYYQNNFDSSVQDEASDFFPLNMTAESKNSLGFHANVGVEIFITEHYVMNVDLKSVFNNTDFVFTYPDGAEETGEVALNGAVYLIGFKYYF